MDINVKIYGYHIDINLRKRNWLAKWYLKFFKVHAKEEFTGNHCFFYMFDHDWFPPLISRTQCFPAAPFRDTAKKTISKVWSEIVLLPTLGASNMQNQNHPGGNPGNHTSTCIYIYIYYIYLYIYIDIHIYMYTVYMYTHVYLQTEQDGYIILGMLSRWNNWTWRLWQQDLLRCSGYKILVILDRVCVYIVHIWVNYNNSLTWNKVI